MWYFCVSSNIVLVFLTLWYYSQAKCITHPNIIAIFPSSLHFIFYGLPILKEYVFLALVASSLSSLFHLTSLGSVVTLLIISSFKYMMRPLTIVIISCPFGFWIFEEKSWSISSSKPLSFLEKPNHWQIAKKFLTLESWWILEGFVGYFLLNPSPMDYYTSNKVEQCIFILLLHNHMVLFVVEDVEEKINHIFSIRLRKIKIKTFTPSY